MPSTRRQFLGTAGLSMVASGTLLPRLLAQAADQAQANGRTDGILVVIELEGGNDGLNTVVPFENDLYYKNRPTLGLPKDQVLKIAQGVGLHPELAPLANLYKEGRLAVVQGVGYPQPDRSHFRSMEIWHNASTARLPLPTGWLGRSLDQLTATKQLAELGGLAMTGSVSPALRAQQNVVPSVTQLDQFAAAANPGEADRKLLRELSTVRSEQASPVTFVRRQMSAIYETAERLQKGAEKYRSTIEYPNTGLGDQLKRSAKIIAADLGVRVFYTSHGGFDTHSYQADNHAGLLSDLADSMDAFQRDLVGLGMADRVVTIVFSEFGRRVDENASQGTDHGAASCLFVLGNLVKGGLYGSYPRLDELGEGDLVFNTDFRRVYATLLDHWLGCPSAGILGEPFEGLGFLHKA